MKNFVQDPTKVRKWDDKGGSRVGDRRSLLRIKREIVMNPGLASGELFKRIGETTVLRTTRCLILKCIAKLLVPIIKPPLSKTRKQNRVKWQKLALRLTFQTFYLRTKPVLPLIDLMAGVRDRSLLEELIIIV